MWSTSRLKKNTWLLYSYNICKIFSHPAYPYLPLPHFLASISNLSCLSPALPLSLLCVLFLLCLSLSSLFCPYLSSFSFSLSSSLSPPFPSVPLSFPLLPLSPFPLLPLFSLSPFLSLFFASPLSRSPSLSFSLPISFFLFFYLLLQPGHPCVCFVTESLYSTNITSRFTWNGLTFYKDFI